MPPRMGVLWRAQVGVCFAAYRNLPHLVRARIVWSGGKLQLWLDLDHSGHYQSCVQTEKGDARMRMPEKGHFGVSASTGSFGDTHVVYSFQLADLQDETVEATPYTGTDTISAAHKVHLDSARSHETHVKVRRTPRTSRMPPHT